MHSVEVLPDGSCLRWVELPGSRPTRVYLHGLGASSAPYFTEAITHPALAGHHSLLIDLLGFGISDRPTDAPYTLEMHADVVARALRLVAVTEADVIAHSMGGAVATVLAARHPDLVRRLVLVDPPLDPVQHLPTTKRPGSSGIGVYPTEEEFLDHGWRETLQFVGPHWAATMRQAGPHALYRSAMSLLHGTVPTTRQHLETLSIPRALLYPAADGPRVDGDRLAAAGVTVVPIPDCGHNIMLDNTDAFAGAVRAALEDEPQRRLPAAETY
ncbi:alpha/beta fold hydrolase [Plantactinospora soyae]|uniref:Pimeloyl-ACP methyl ester carboxylesterase n=1 Tax=Plantactinospora soyae TaxID=1544732 RepID=A0A927R453_9ACTN|nr:alpha/beta hydrolase [Plantactinospora soyae]MBE1492463.1 pimeloyl-ACP methyl ester carboxylesterase [Plantactinospora soyae]